MPLAIHGIVHGLGWRHAQVGKVTHGVIYIRTLYFLPVAVSITAWWRAPKHGLDRRHHKCSGDGSVGSSSKALFRRVCWRSGKLSKVAAGRPRLISPMSDVQSKLDRGGTLLAHHWFFEPRGGERVLAELAALFPAAPVSSIMCRGKSAARCRYGSGEGTGVVVDHSFDACAHA